MESRSPGSVLGARYPAFGVDPAPEPGTWYLGPGTRYRINAEDRTPSTEDRPGHWETRTSGLHLTSCIHFSWRIYGAPHPDHGPVAGLHYCRTP